MRYDLRRTISIRQRGCEGEQHTHSHAGNVSVVVDQAPLFSLQVQLEDMVIDLVGVLVEASESINVVVPDIGDGRIDKTGRPLTNGGHDLGHIGIMVATAGRVGACGAGRGGHNIGVVGAGGKTRGRRGC